VKRQPAIRSERSIRREPNVPESILPALDGLATLAGLPTLLELAVSGRADTSQRVCRGPTWTNVAQRSLYLLYAVVSDFGPATPREHLLRIREMRSIGVNWVYGVDDSPAGHALFNFGTFYFDTTELRRLADQLLEQPYAGGQPDQPLTRQSATTRSASYPPSSYPPSSYPPSATGERPTGRPAPGARLHRLEPAAPAGAAGEPQDLDEIIEEQQEAVRSDPTALEPYRALHKLYLYRGEFDRAWCACQALSLLGKANDHERQFFEDYRPKGLLPIKSRLDTVLWKKNLYHHDESLDIAHIFEVLAPAALKLKIHLLRESNQLSVMDERFKQEPKGSTVTLVKTFGWAADAFGIRCPDLYVRTDLPGALVAVPMRPPASLAGSTACSGLQPQELAFVVGKHMSFYRGDHYVKCLFSDPSELSALFSAAIELVGVDAPRADVEVAQFRDLLDKCVEQDRMGALRQAVHRWVKSRAPADIARWSQAVEFTACRAGLLLSGDLGAAWAMINAEPQTPGDAPTEEKLKDLFVFAVSAEYFALRTLLGVTIA
jgi:hypothetical protein